MQDREKLVAQIRGRMLSWLIETWGVRHMNASDFGLHCDRQLVSLDKIIASVNATLDQVEAKNQQSNQLRKEGRDVK